MSEEKFQPNLRIRTMADLMIEFREELEFAEEQEVTAEHLKYLEEQWHTEVEDGFASSEVRDDYLDALEKRYWQVKRKENSLNQIVIETKRLRSLVIAALEYEYYEGSKLRTFYLDIYDKWIETADEVQALREKLVDWNYDFQSRKFY